LHAGEKAKVTTKHKRRFCA